MVGDVIVFFLVSHSIENLFPYPILKKYDLIGPYKVGYYGTTMIVQAIRWPEFGVQPNKESITTAESFDREWLCRSHVHEKLYTTKDYSLQEKNYMNYYAVTA